MTAHVVVLRRPQSAAEPLDTKQTAYPGSGALRQRIVPSQVSSVTAAAAGLRRHGRVPPAFTSEAIASFLSACSRIAGRPRRSTWMTIRPHFTPVAVHRRVATPPGRRASTQFRRIAGSTSASSAAAGPRSFRCAELGNWLVAVGARRRVRRVARAGPRPVGRKDREQQDGPEDHRHGQQVDDRDRRPAQPAVRLGLHALRRRCRWRTAASGSEAGTGGPAGTG